MSSLDLRRQDNTRSMSKESFAGSLVLSSSTSTRRSRYRILRLIRYKATSSGSTSARPSQEASTEVSFGLGSFLGRVRSAKIVVSIDEPICPVFIERTETTRILAAHVVHGNTEWKRLGDYADTMCVALTLSTRSMHIESLVYITKSGRASVEWRLRYRSFNKKVTLGNRSCGNLLIPRKA